MNNNGEQNEVLSMDNNHSLDDVLQFASLFPVDESGKTENTFDVDRALA